MELSGRVALAVVRERIDKRRRELRKLLRTQKLQVKASPKDSLLREGMEFVVAETRGRLLEVVLTIQQLEEIEEAINNGNVQSE